MGSQGNAPIIIKRKKVVSGGGHHGGAWKVAYADFVTAMMAFFMLMWLLNATTEQQRKGIADYFSPTLPINRISGGGDGMFGGDNIFSEETLARNGTGGSSNTNLSSPITVAAPSDNEVRAANEVASLEDIEEVLLGQGGESILSENAMRHVVTRLTDEGLIIEVFDLPGSPLFLKNTSDPTEPAREIAHVLARVSAMVKNNVAITGHTAARSVLLRENPVWQLSADRAMAMRLLLEEGGFDPHRMQRVTGSADRILVTRNPFSERNNRLEIVFLRSKF